MSQRVTLKNLREAIAKTQGPAGTRNTMSAVCQENGEEDRLGAHQVGSLEGTGLDHKVLRKDMLGSVLSLMSGTVGCHSSWNEPAGCRKHVCLYSSHAEEPVIHTHGHGENVPRDAHSVMWCPVPSSYIHSVSLLMTSNPHRKGLSGHLSTLKTSVAVTTREEYRVLVGVKVPLMLILLSRGEPHLRKLSSSICQTLSGTLLFSLSNFP